MKIVDYETLQLTSESHAKWNFHHAWVSVALGDFRGAAQYMVRAAKHRRAALSLAKRLK